MNFLMLSPFFYMDYARPWQVFFQKPATTMMEGIIDLHHDIFTFLIIILSFVSVMMLTTLVRFIEKDNQYRIIDLSGSTPFMKYKIAHGVTHHTVLETVWTIIPTLILLVIVTPSFALIYALDEVIDPELTIRVVGRQWYWTYEYPDQVRIRFPVSWLEDSAEGQEVLREYHQGSPSLVLSIPGFSFNSYLVPTEDLFYGSFRLLEVTRRVVVPALTNVRILVTSYDVIHSWAVPSFGVKVDALPGRLNEYFIHVNFLGIFFGQCSEICGVNHGFMPIKVESVTDEIFRWWYLETSLGENVALKFRKCWHYDRPYAFPVGISKYFHDDDKYDFDPFRSVSRTKPFSGVTLNAPLPGVTTVRPLLRVNEAFQGEYVSPQWPYLKWRFSTKLNLQEVRAEYEAKLRTFGKYRNYGVTTKAKG